MKLLEKYRKAIDREDKKILQALSRRLQNAEKIGKLKKELGLPVFQKNRWAEVIKTRRQLSKALGLSAPFVSALYHVIHEEAVRIQNKKGKK